jgi:hypothetical protein
MHATGVAAAVEVKGLRLVDNELLCPQASNNVFPLRAQAGTATLSR